VFGWVSAFVYWREFIPIIINSTLVKHKKLKAQSEQPRLLPSHDWAHKNRLTLDYHTPTKVGVWCLLVIPWVLI
jgi:hypothetical protein